MAEEKRAATVVSAKPVTTATPMATTAKSTVAPTQPTKTTTTTTPAPAKIQSAASAVGTTGQNVWLQRAQRMSTGTDRM
jgi:hypothetical protein